MEPAWTDRSQAYQYAFGEAAGRLAKRVVLLHKDRLREVATFLPEVAAFSGRWRGIRTGDREIAFIAVPGGVADVSDCLFHLALHPPEALFFTGTCGGISEELSVGSLCMVQKGWLPSGNVLDWMDDPDKLVQNSRRVQAIEPVSTSTIADRIKHLFGLESELMPSFSVPFQSIESLHFIQAVRQLGAKVIDMESAIFLGIAERLTIPALCLLWCTDRPEDISYYALKEEPVRQKCYERWALWPEIVGKVFF